jgi:hypothetical protein
MKMIKLSTWQREVTAEWAWTARNGRCQVCGEWGTETWWLTVRDGQGKGANGLVNACLSASRACLGVLLVQAALCGEVRGAPQKEAGRSVSDKTTTGSERDDEGQAQRGDAS